MNLIIYNYQLSTMNTKKIFYCSICLEDIEDNVEFLPCIHGFHKECIDKWVNEKPLCPICKIPIMLNTVEQLGRYNENNIDNSVIRTVNFAILLNDIPLNSEGLNFDLLPGNRVNPDRSFSESIVNINI
jgi:hypothetical protein